MAILVVIGGFLGFMMNTINSRFTAMKNRFDGVNGRIDSLGAELNGRIDNLCAELHRDHAGLEERLRAVEVRLTPAEPAQ